MRIRSFLNLFCQHRLDNFLVLGCSFFGEDYNWFLKIFHEQINKENDNNSKLQNRSCFVKLFVFVVESTVVSKTFNFDCLIIPNPHF